MSLNGVDIAGYQRGIDIYDLTADFIIVKATEGTQGTIYNPDYRDMADAVLDTGRLLGFYHYANGEDPIAEADSFFDAIRDYKGHAVPCLDWEGQGNDLFMSGEDVWWCEAFMDRISSLMGSTCLFYTSKGICRLYDWEDVARRYPLWGAEYAYDSYVYDGYEPYPWQSPQSWGPWGEYPTIHQYGYVLPRPSDGGVGALDGDILYATRGDWEAMGGTRKPHQDAGGAINDVGLWYQVHVQDIGWCEPVHDGQTAGTVGFNKRLEAVRLTKIPKGWRFRAKAHIQNEGWRTFDASEGTVIGTVGKGRAIEMLIFDAVEKPDARQLRFRVHQQNVGWKSWTHEGFASGTDGMGLRLEALEMTIW